MPHPVILPTGRTLPPFLAPPDPISVFTQSWELGWLQAEDEAFLKVPSPLAACGGWDPAVAGLSLSGLRRANISAPELTATPWLAKVVSIHLGRWRVRESPVPVPSLGEVAASWL